MRKTKILVTIFAIAACAGLFYASGITKIFVGSIKPILVLQDDTVCKAPPSGMIVSWNGEDDAKNATQNAVTFVPGKVGNAFYFDGKGSFIEGESSFNFADNAPFTLELWVKPDAATGINQFILGNRDTQSRGWNVRIRTNNKFSFALEDGPTNLFFADSDNVVKPGNWYHLVAVYSQSAGKLYVDGKLQNSVSTFGKPQNFESASMLSLGRAPTKAWHFKGAVDEARIYDRAITEQEIQILFSQSDVFYCPSQQRKSAVQPATLSPSAPMPVPVAPVFENKITYTTDLSASFGQRVTNEFTRWLPQMTSATFLVQQKAPDAALSGGGIILALANSAFVTGNAPAEVKNELPKLTAATKESFLVISDTASRLWILSNSEKGLVHGIYYYLEKLGMRWYFPGDKWVYAPKISSAFITLNDLQVPDFKTFSYGFSGGFGGILPIAHYDEPQKHWNLWIERNRFPSEGIFAGHNSFLNDKDAELRRDPLYMAEVAGTRKKMPPVAPTLGKAAQHETKYSMTYHGQVACVAPGRTLITFAERETKTKTLSCPADLGKYSVVSHVDTTAGRYCEDPCDYAGNDGVIKLFNDWYVNAFKSFERRVPGAYTFSVEPPDGGEFDESWKAKNLLRNGPYGLNLNQDATDSDNVFHLSNLAARRLRQELPGKYVDLLAYFTHAAPPTIPIEANTIVQIAAYAFHFSYTKMTPEELISAWQQKKRTNPLGQFKLGIYDYWASPDTVHDLPYMGVEKAVSHLKFFHANDAHETFTGESSPAIGPLGLTWYVASKLAWDINADYAALLDRFYADMFGPAQAEMKQMLTRWNALDFKLTTHELGLAYQNLAAASRLAGNDAQIQSRIDDFKRYVHYMRLRFEYEHLPSNSPAKFQKAEELMKYTWRIYDSLMVHSFHNNVLLRSATRAQSPAFFQKWDWKTGVTYGANLQTLLAGAALGFREIAAAGQVTSAELAQLMAGGAAIYTPVNFTEKKYTEDLLPLRISSSSQTHKTVIYSHTNTFKFFKSAGVAAPFIEMHPQGSPQGAPLRVKLANEQGTVLMQQDVPVSLVKRSDLSALPEGLYTLKVTSFDSSEFYWFVLPENLPFASVGESHFSFTNLKDKFFFVPQGVSTLMMYANSATAPKFYTPPNYTSAAFQQHGPNLYEINIPAGKDGAIWSVSDLVPTNNSKVHFYNAPDVIAPSPDQVMVPRELCTTVSGFICNL